jgi:hypothetical protein
MTLDSFADRELRAGEMAVVFYRKHPSQDNQLQVRWLSELVHPVETLMKQPDFRRHLEAFDAQTNHVFHALAVSLEALLEMESGGLGVSNALSPDRLRAALNNVLRIVFDVQRTRGKVQEWFSTVEDPAKVAAAQSLASVLRKIEFLNRSFDQLSVQAAIPAGDGEMAAALKGLVAGLEGTKPTLPSSPPGRGRTLVQRLTFSPAVFRRLILVDRFVQSRLQSPARRRWLAHYGRVRSRIRRLLA